MLFPWKQLMMLFYLLKFIALSKSLMSGSASYKQQVNSIFKRGMFGLPLIVFFVQSNFFSISFQCFILPPFSVFVPVCVRVRHLIQLLGSVSWATYHHWRSFFSCLQLTVQGICSFWKNKVFILWKKSFSNLLWKG